VDVETTSFGDYFVEQDFFSVFHHFARLAAAYFIVFAGMILILLRRRRRRFVVTSLAMAGLTLAAFLVGLTLFEAAGLYYRYDPPGVGVQRSGEDLADFYFQFKVVFVLLYGGAIAFAALAGHLVGRRFAGSGRTVAAVVVGAMAGFLLFSFPAVEYQNSCDIGDSLFIDRHCG
jgi:hypothetical protein